MTINQRKLLGTLIMLVGLTSYILVVAILVTLFLPPWILLHALVYMIAGIAWVFPLRPLMRWMNRPDPE